MSKVLFLATYDVLPQHREEYLDAVATLRRQSGALRAVCTITEDTGKKNRFTEVWEFGNEADFESFDDRQTDEYLDAVEHIYELIRGGAVQYTTLKAL